MKKLENVKAVIFDLDDTLYDFHSANNMAEKRMCERAKALLGVDAEAFRQVYWESFDDILAGYGRDHEHEVGNGHSRTLRLQRCMEKLQKPLFPAVLELYDVYWGTVLDNLVPEPNIQKTLEELRNKGYHIGCGTNMTAHIQYEKISRLGLGGYFEFMVCSEETVEDKPSPVFFRRVVQKAAAVCAGPVSAGNCLFIGDGLVNDYRGPLEAGLQAVWYNRRGQRGQGDEQSIRDMIELCEML